MQNSPSRLAVHESTLTDRRNRPSQVRNFKKQNGLVSLRIRLHALSLQANESSAAIELRMMPGLLIRNFKPHRLDVERLRPLKVFEIKLYADESRSRLTHDSPPVSEFIPRTVPPRRRSLHPPRSAPSGAEYPIRGDSRTIVADSS